VGSLANACTETNTPERTKKVPIKLNPKVTIANNNVHPLKTARFSATIKLWIQAVATSHGNKDAFSTGSQNHQPPQPSSRYAHQLPSTMPQPKQAQGIIIQGRHARAHKGSSLPCNSTAMAKAKPIAKPT